MSIKLNEIHTRTLQAYASFQAQPALHPFMPRALLASLRKQVAFLEPLLQIVAGATDADDAGVAAIDAIYQRTHDMILRIHEGVRYRYSVHTEAIVAIAPLRVGRNPDEDLLRLQTLAQRVPEMRPAFVWLPDESFTHAAALKQIKAHQDANAREPSLNVPEQKVREALEELRLARPASHELWYGEGGLEAWIIAHVPPSQQHQFGRERRQKPRAAKTAPPSETTKPPVEK